MAQTIAIILTDSKKKILWVNDGFTGITGYLLSEVMGKKPSLLQGPGSEQEAIRRIRKGIEHQTPFSDQITNYRKNGEEYLCRLAIHPIFNQHQELTNFIAFEVDGSVHPQLEQLPMLQIEDKYSSSNLKGLEELKLFTRLKELMNQERIFLDPNLTLRMVADQLNTNTKYLSQVVNRQAGKNFQYFINSYRIAEVKGKINSTAYQQLTLYGIALQCGFKNKSTFYKVFKEITGITPKKYMRAPNFTSNTETSEQLLQQMIPDEQ